MQAAKPWWRRPMWAFPGGFVYVFLVNMLFDLYVERSSSVGYAVLKTMCQAPGLLWMALASRPRRDGR